MKRITSKLTASFAVLLLFAAAVTTANSQEKPKVIDADALAARGEAIANADPDPLAVELRNREPEGSSGRRGFYIGMAVAEGQTLPGPGKDRFGNSLSRAEQGAFRTAVSFSVDRKRNADLASTGAAIAKVDPIVAAARTVDQDVLYWLGFDIATGIFGDPALGAQGKTAKGPGSLGIRDLLSDRAKRGFNASMEFHLSRRGSASPAAAGRTSGAAVVSGDYTDTGKVGGVAAVDTDLNSPYTEVYSKNSAGAAAVILATRPPSNEIRCRGGRDRLIFTAENSKLDSTRETITTILLTSEPGPYASGPRGEGLRPGECSWTDRPMDFNDRFVLIRFETPANAQLKQKLHGSQVDTSPTAAETYPDARTIPEYLNDPNHYWSFLGIKRVNNTYTATGHGYFRRPLDVVSPGRIKDRDRVLIPKKPE